MGVSPERKRSWVESANDPQTDFPLENLPFGVFDDGAGGRPGLAIGDGILDLRGCGLRDDERRRARELLTDPAQRAHVEPHLIAQSSVRMLPPFAIGDYTDFYASIHHATNVGRLFRPDTSAAPQLQMGAHRLSRTRVVHRRQRDRSAAALRTDQTSRRC